MSQIFELFGYPIDKWNNEAWENLKKANCPFMSETCDGGGNRNSTEILLGNGKLRKFFHSNITSVQPGVCSLLLHESDKSPWIVCPRRLLNFRQQGLSKYQDVITNAIKRFGELRTGEKYRVWSEIKLKCKVNGEKGKISLFDYTFDYVIAGSQRQSIKEIRDSLKMSLSEVRKTATENAFTLSADENFIEDFPSKPLLIIEVMTSSTSGGNKKNRSQIAQLFEDTILKLSGEKVSPCGPGINYRQVWARMVSQLLVKSQIGKAWDGCTIWTVQDLLSEYISKTTALDLDEFISNKKDEVNILSNGYSLEKEAISDKLYKLSNIVQYSGSVAPDSTEKSFVDIIKLGATPSINELWRLMFNKKACSEFTV